MPHNTAVSICKPAVCGGSMTDSILFSLTGCFRPAIRKFMTALQAQIDELNLKHGLGPGHNKRKRLLG